MSDGGGKDQITHLVRFKIDNHRRPILKTGFLPVPPVLSVTLCNLDIRRSIFDRQQAQLDNKQWHARLNLDSHPSNILPLLLLRLLIRVAHTFHTLSTNCSNIASIKGTPQPKTNWIIQTKYQTKLRENPKQWACQRRWCYATRSY